MRFPIELLTVLVLLVVMTVTYFYCGDAVTVCECVGG